MTKEQYAQFVSDCESAGITQWSVRFEGGNRSAVHGYQGCRIIPRDEDIIIIESTNNYATSNGQFNITSCNYDVIDNVRTLDATFQQTIDLLTTMGIYDDDMRDFIKTSVKRQPIIPGTAGLSTIKDADGNDVIPPGSVGYVTK